MNDLILQKPWGEFKNLCVNQNNVTVKIITVKKGQRTSLQMHWNRTEYWIIVKGNAICEFASLPSLCAKDNTKPTISEFQMSEGDELEINKEQIHRLSAPDMDCTLIEISQGNFDEDDIVRLQDDYGRAI